MLRHTLVEGLQATKDLLFEAEKPLRKPPVVVQARDHMDFFASPQRGVVLEKKIVCPATGRKRAIDLPWTALPLS